MRRPFGFLPPTIALIVVALLASPGGLAATVSRAVHAALAETAAPAHPRADGASSRASEPDVPGRTAFLHAQPAPVARIHASHTSGSDGARSAPALGVDRAMLELAARRAPGAAVDARQDGVTSPGQPAPSSRAPPIA
jgi:hypothetical protein